MNPSSGTRDGSEAGSGRGRLAGLVVPTLVLFASNSLLCRGALVADGLTPVTFTAVRLASGAACLGLVVRLGGGPAPRPASRRSWPAGLALLAYAVSFSYSYVRIEAGVGALLLFAAVQATLVARGLATGERPGRQEWTGLAVALVGLVVLTRPGTSAPDPAGALLMIGAGVAWGAYTWMGRDVDRPVQATSRNFTWASLGVVPLVALGGLGPWDSRGVLFAVLSGAIASGLGYSLWYAAMPSLTATRAAIVQLAVPVIAAFGGVALLGEAVTPRLVAAGATIVGGIALAIAGRRAPS